MSNYIDMNTIKNQNIIRSANLFKKLKNKQCTLQQYYELCKLQANSLHFRAYKTVQDRNILIHPQLQTHTKKPNIPFEHISECIASVFQALDDNDPQLIQEQLSQIKSSLQKISLIIGQKNQTKDYDQINKLYQKAQQQHLQQHLLTRMMKHKIKTQVLQTSQPQTYTQRVTKYNQINSKIMSQLQNIGQAQIPDIVIHNNQRQIYMTSLVNIFRNTSIF